MKYLTRFVLVTIVLAAALVLIYSLTLGGCPHRGKAFEQWQTTSGPFRIRITAYEEDGRSFSASRPFYVFETDSIGPEDWREIMITQDESRPPIPREQVRFVNDQIGYVYMGSKCGVTTDGGKTWSIWDAGKTLPKSLLYDYRGIRQVSIANNGIGTMQLERAPQSRGDWQDLYTSDYGYHWNPK
jgi:hypothetical protein